MSLENFISAYSRQICVHCALSSGNRNRRLLQVVRDQNQNNCNIQNAD